MSSGSEVVDQINATLAEAVNQAATNGTAKFKSTPEGMFVAYGSLVVMALIPIFYGSFRSIGFQKEQKESGEKLEPMSRKEAALFPLYASCALVGLYVFFKFFSKEHINLLLSAYFFVLGTISLSSVLSNLVEYFLGRFAPNLLKRSSKFHMLFTQDEGEIINLNFDTKDIASFIGCAGIGVWYILKKHWIANNLFGFAFAIKAIEYINLNNIVTGCILLCGLFVYDIFWVFGTDVMVTVAKSFDAPIKLIFPQDFLENGVYGSQFAMLGLGDIVIPGIFIALLLRFDVSLNRGKNVYFYTSFIAYIVGLLITMLVMVYFKHAQPALLYLVPCCIIFPFTVSLFKGDFMTLFKYEEHSTEEEEEEPAQQQNEAEQKKSK